MKRLSHLTVALATLMLLLFGTGGIGWQRCSCTGRVSLVLPTHKGCCGNNSSCMTVTITQVSTADLQQEPTTLQGALPMVSLATICSDIRLPLSYARHIAWQNDWIPPGWASAFGMVMQV